MSSLVPHTCSAKKKKKRNPVVPKNVPVKAITNYFIKCPSCNTLFNNLCDKMEKKKKKKKTQNFLMPTKIWWLAGGKTVWVVSRLSHIFKQHFYLKEWLTSKLWLVTLRPISPKAWRAAIHGVQRVGHDWATELSWTELAPPKKKNNLTCYFKKNNWQICCQWWNLSFQLKS